MNVWGDRTTHDLSEVIRQSMPPSGPAPDANSTVAVVAYILQANGTSAGPRALTSETPVQIGAVAANEASVALPRNVQSAPPRVRPDAVPPTRTVAGEVRDYVPVTDAMLRDPDASDWLMVRGNYQGWSYTIVRSRPSQVTTWRI